MKRRGKSRRRNPGGIVGMAMRMVETALPALSMGAALGALDVKLGEAAAKGGWQHARAISVAAKVGAGIAALVGGTFKPSLSKYLVPAACAAFACVGQDLGAKLAGGVIGGSKQMAAKEIAVMAGEDEETFGLVLNEMQGMGIIALNGMGDPSDEAAAAFSGTDPLEVGDGF
jgi:hypothetical protein